MTIHNLIRIAQMVHCKREIHRLPLFILRKIMQESNQTAILIICDNQRQFLL
jgi:hypothetical protein